MGLLSTPIGLGAKAVRGLMDMSTPARMERAEDMGFDTDTTWYHGSPVAASIDKFDLSLPKVTDEGFLGNAVYMTPQSYIAKAYARNDYDSGVLDLFTSAKKFKDFDYIDQSSYLKSIDDFSREIGVKPKFKTKEWANDFAEKMQANGYEGARGLNADGSVAELAVYDTSKLRKINAAFDPAKASSSNLLASNPVATTSAALMANVTGQPSNLSSYMQGNTDAYLTNAERQYLQNKQAFESNFSDDTGWDRADILPFRVNEQTGEREFATPEMIKGLLSGLYDIGQSKNTKISNPASLLELI